MLSQQFRLLGRPIRHVQRLSRSSLRTFSQSASRGSDQGLTRLSTIWSPNTRAIEKKENESGHDMMLRAGLLRQTHAGLFHLLPFGLRIQQKIETLLDKHMRTIGASRVSLSSISSESLWRKSGRLHKIGSEFFRLKDRKGTKFLLSPTHEEEITSLVSGFIQSYKDAPLRLFQITRKYRDELRPRHGLLRGREFLMKDLYTFDVSREKAMETYQAVSTAYTAFFADLKLPVVTAEASSGDMGGDLSHEYHLPHSIGADSVASCAECGYAANDEVATFRPSPERMAATPEWFVWRGSSLDQQTLINAWYPRSWGSEGLNLEAVKAAVPDADISSTSAPTPHPGQIEETSRTKDVKVKVIDVVDARLATSFEEVRSRLPLPECLKDVKASRIDRSTISVWNNSKPLDLSKMQDGDGCPRCEEGILRVSRALELGHTFHLGTQYTEPLGLAVSLPETPAKKTPLQMGCHGIGVSRIMGSVAEFMADSQGLMWPRAIAPFEVAIIPSSTGQISEEVLSLCDDVVGDGIQTPRLEVLLNDTDMSFGPKIKDADLVGYPVVVILGKAWREQKYCEVQCRRLECKETVPVSDVPTLVRSLLAKL